MASRSYILTILTSEAARFPVGPRIRIVVVKIHVTPKASLHLITTALGCQTVGFVIVAFIPRAQVARLVGFVLLRDYECGLWISYDTFNIL